MIGSQLPWVAPSGPMSSSQWRIPAIPGNVALQGLGGKNLFAIGDLGAGLAARELLFNILEHLVRVHRRLLRGAFLGAWQVRILKLGLDHDFVDALFQVVKVLLDATQRLVIEGKSARRLSRPCF